jgi:hypothetical protein
MTFRQWIMLRRTSGDFKSRLTDILRLKLSYQDFSNWSDIEHWMRSNNAMPHTLKIGKALWRQYERCVRNMSNANRLAGPISSRAA